MSIIRRATSASPPSASRALHHTQQRLSDPGTGPSNLFMAAGIEGTAAAAWSLWGLAGQAQPGPYLALVGLVIGLALTARCARLRRTLTPGGPAIPPTRRKAYFATLGGEMAAIAVGVTVLGVTGHSAYVPSLVAFVVGVHFVVLAAVFASGNLSAVAIIMIAGAVASTAAGLSGASADAIRGLAAVPSAAALLFGSFVALRRATRLVNASAGTAPS